MPKTAPSSQIVTRSQSGKKKSLRTHTHIDFCTSPHSESVPSKTTVMNDDQKKEFENFFLRFVQFLKTRSSQGIIHPTNTIGFNSVSPSTFESSSVVI